ncbi:MAG TPA: amidohydrolase family protein [Leptospiraceae bacterium]|nr:amidohydrolase family protein [Leptospiraceae bacterium]
MNMTAEIIDVHHHFVPDFYADALNKAGYRKVAGAELPDWTPERSLKVMDMNGIRTAVTSISSPGVFFGNAENASLLARKCNEYMAELKIKFPERFGSFAVLPMPLPDRSVLEAVYALDQLKCEGIVLLGSTEGKFLGHPDFDALMEELNRRNAAVFVHPNLHRTSELIDLSIPGFIVEFLCDTVRAAVNLIYSGTMEKFPNIRWVLSHAGGFLPYIAWRVSLGNLFPGVNEKAPAGILNYINRFYYDTALSPSPYVVSALKELVEPDHILYGSDFPFAPESLVFYQREEFEALKQIDESERRKICRINSLKLFPALASKEEKTGKVLPAEKTSISQKLKFRMNRTAVSVLSKLMKR